MLPVVSDYGAPVVEAGSGSVSLGVMLSWHEVQCVLHRAAQSGRPFSGCGRDSEVMGSWLFPFSSAFSC